MATQRKTLGNGRKTHSKVHRITRKAHEDAGEKVKRHTSPRFSTKVKKWLDEVEEAFMPKKTRKNKKKSY